MRFRTICIILVLSLITCDLLGQEHRRSIRDRMFSDTMVVSKNYNKAVAKSTKFYDTLYRHKSWFTRLVAPLIITSPSNTIESGEPTPVLEVGRHYFRNYQGRTITQINILQANVFTRDSSKKISRAERLIDGLHALTSEKVIRKNLLFEVGETVDPYSMAINEEMLRSLPYISTAYIMVVPDPKNPSEVVVNVFARDNWTISGTVAWGGANHYGELFDRNFLGTGNALHMRYYFPFGEQKNGAEVQYRINNLWGTFTNVNLVGGIGATNNTARIEASRPFILPSDHIWGLNAGYTHNRVGIGTIDTSMIIKRADYGLWYGYSWNLDPRQGTALYAMASTAYTQFYQRPEICKGVNPYFYNRFTTLASVGVSRQNYFQGNMIYGYGRTEDISYGYKFDFTGGYEWNEVLGRRVYLGLTALWGDMIGSSYFGVSTRVGGFRNLNKEWEQCAIDLSANFFSPLFKLGNIYVRQFLSTSATWGLNRLMGEREQIGYNSVARMQGMGPRHNSMGHNRATFGGETVFFTPIFFYHFRFAFFVWGDVGVLGYNKAIFSNPLSSVLGLGVRIKNERLIFNNIQLRLGFAVRRPPDYGFNPFSVSNEEILRQHVFRPSLPEVLPYQ